MNRLTGWIVWGLACLAFAMPAAAQNASGIAGVVRDASGGVLPGVTVDATSPALIEKVRSVISDDASLLMRFSINGEPVVTFVRVTESLSMWCTNPTWIFMSLGPPDLCLDGMMLYHCPGFISRTSIHRRLRISSDFGFGSRKSALAKAPNGADILSGWSISGISTGTFIV